MNAEMHVVGDLPPSKSANDSSPLAMDAVYDALRSNLGQLRRHDRAVAELSAALEICAKTGDKQAVELLSEMRRTQ
jgi:hypothetical protein